MFAIDYGPVNVLYIQLHAILGGVDITDEKTEGQGD
jgi:hypothetical protein